MTESRMVVPDSILKNLMCAGGEYAQAAVNAARCYLVLQQSAKKHMDKPHRGALSDLAHAGLHLLADTPDGVDEETGQPHLIHAAVDCLLAFCSIIGAIENCEGPVLKEG